MTLNGFMAHDFFDQSTPHRAKIDTNNMQDTEPKRVHNPEEIMSFLRKDMLTLLGQGPVKKIPKRSEERLKKQAEKREEKLTPEEEKEIKEIFGEHYDTIIHFD